MRRRQAAALMAIVTIAGIGQAFPAATELKAKTVQRIVVSIPHRKLAVIRDGEVIKTFRTAVGAKSSPSPEGSFTVVNRIVKPTYYKPGKVIPAGPANPLGTRWMGLSLKGFGIHGTNAPNSIGKAESHGCVRLRNRDVEELFELVQVGDIVELRGPSDETALALFGPVPAAKPATVQKPVASKPEAKPAVSQTLALGSLAGR